MPEADYRYLLADDAEVVVELRTERGQIDSYSVVLLARENDEWRTVRVYDNDLGMPHMHRYSRAGEKQPREKTPCTTTSEGYNMALDCVRDGFREMIIGWMS